MNIEVAEILCVALVVVCFSAVVIVALITTKGE